MSSPSASALPVEDLTCAVCHDIFRDPVLLSCSHTFCEACVHQWWTHNIIRRCPVCKEVHTSRNLPRNLALKNLCEAYRQERERALKRKRDSEEELCAPHGERLKLFCEQCQQAVCVVCRDSKKHTDHRCRPVDEASLDRKEEVRTLLKPLEERLELYKKSDQRANHFRIQARAAERQIREQFAKLHRFLQEEEEASLVALRTEEKHKALLMKDKIEGLRRDVSTLRHTIAATQEQLKAEPVSFLKNYKTTVERARGGSSLPDPQPVSGPVIDLAKHLGNLAFRVWKKMTDIVHYHPVVLDPNTAHPVLLVSPDLTSVSPGEEGQLLPVNPERFDHYGYVLGSEGFDSGSTRWDVEVGDNEDWELGHNDDWELGVLADSYQRTGRGGGQLFGMAFYEGKYTAVSKPHGGATVTQLLPAPMHRPQRISVQLDWKEGKLSFSDADSSALIHAFTQCAFTHTLFPYLSTAHACPLKVLPAPVRLKSRRPEMEQCDFFSCKC